MNDVWQAIRSFFSGPPTSVAIRDSGARRGALWARLALRINLILLLLAIFGYALTQGVKWEILRLAGLGLLLAAASFLVGATLGFLFGIPRRLQQSPSPSSVKDNSQGSEDEGAQPAEAQTGYQSNTSLEQISDWLTKILVGLTLTQWTSIRQEFQNMIEYTAPAFGTGSEVFVGGTVTVGALCGFFSGYLPTRLFLWLALTESDVEGFGLFNHRKDQNVADAESVRNTPKPAQAAEGQEPGAREAASMELRQKINALSQQYESLRAKFRPGDARTMEMEKILSEMRKLAPQFDSNLQAELQKSGSPGQRLAAVAWLQVYPQASELDWLANCLGSEKPFIGYHAAVALLTAARNASTDPAQVLKAINRAQAFLKPTDAGTDRAKILAEAEQVVKSRM